MNGAGETAGVDAAVRAQRPGRIRWDLVLPVLIGCALLVTMAVRNRGTVDDAFISFRYLDNGLAGHGLVFNQGERVEGYSNLLWILLLAPLRAAGMRPELAADILSVLAAIALLAASARIATTLASSSRAGAIALTLLGGAAPFAAWILTGMETTLYAALLALAAWRLTVRHGFDQSAALLFGLAALTRPEGLFVGVLTFLALATRDLSALRTRWRATLAPLPALVALPCIQVLWRLSFYGHPLPNTYYAKLGGVSVAAAVHAGLGYVVRFARDGGLPLLLLALFALVWTAVPRSRTLHLWAIVLATFAFAIRSGGDYFPFYRFLVAALSPLAVLGSLALLSIGRWRSRFHRGLAASVASIVAVLSFGAWVLSHQGEQMRQMVRVAREQEKLAHWLREEARDGDVLAINAAGRIPYRTGLVTIDMLGLSDGTIARSAIVPEVGGFTMVGHQKHNGAYVCSRRPRFVVPGGAAARTGRSVAEAEVTAALNSFPSDRDFLRHCGEEYRPIARELDPGRYLVVFERRTRGSPAPLFDPPTATAKEWFDEGVRLLAAGDPASAVEAFQASLARAPGVLVARVNLAFALLDAGRLDEAKRAWNSLAALPSPPAEAFFGLALCAELSGDLARAATLWREYLRRAPEGSPWALRAREHLDLLGH